MKLVESSDNIVGTWTSAPQDAYIYAFGMQSTIQTSMVYTFNADGTGEILALGRS